ncbi:MAG TPA: hypothetical protein VHZ29_12430 [Rhizomicrobium sp.]|jgi:hypothetical protein|nr:hypothetical protein [Rhizomicrobium sp.]
MKKFAKAALGAFMLASGTLAFAGPASAQAGISFGFGDGFYGFDSCDYYGYYDQAPPWGLPDDYCDYPVYFEPVFFDGFWYRGPIFYRWTHGHRMFWLNGGWREDSRAGRFRRASPGRIAAVRCAASGPASTSAAVWRPIRAAAPGRAAMAAQAFMAISVEAPATTERD